MVAGDRATLGLVLHHPEPPFFFFPVVAANHLHAGDHGKYFSVIATIREADPLIPSDTKRLEGAKPAGAQVHHKLVRR